MKAWDKNDTCHWPDLAMVLDHDFINHGPLKKVQFGEYQPNIKNDSHNIVAGFKYRIQVVLGLRQQWGLKLPLLSEHNKA